MKNDPMAQTDSGHDSLHSENETSPPIQQQDPIYAPVRQSNGFDQEGRSRRSLASLSGGDAPGGSNNIYEDPDKFQHPPNITPVGGVPNLKGKVVIRPIAFRPSPGRPGSSAGPTSSGPQTSSRPGSSTFQSPQRPGSSAPSPGLSSGYRTPVQTPLSSSAISTPGQSTLPNRPPSQGFAPGHPLVKDGHRPFGSSQELNRNQPPPISSKFNSLDRRSVGQRSCRGLLQGANTSTTQNIPSNGLRLSTFTGYEAGSSTSLPPVGLTPVVAPPAQRDPVRGTKEPERRHSLYDSASRGQYQQSATRNNNLNNNQTNGSNNNGAISAMNVNGLPEPFGPPLSRPPSSSHLHSSRNSLQQEPRTRHSGAGTPQFRNLAGIQFPVPRSSRGSLSNINNYQGSTAYSIQRSISGNNLYIEDPNGLIDSSFKGSTSTIDQEFNSTPSPSDSAVGDLENVLKEKDSEIIYLRETMEQNEQVIFKVYEEKERVWERELRKIKGVYENRLKGNQQKASKMEQALMNQTLQVQNEKRKLEAELEEVQRARNEQLQEARALETELSSLRKSLEECEWSSCEKSGEISLLKSQIEDNHGKEDSKVQEMIDLRVEIAEVKRLLEVRNMEVRDLKTENKQMHNEVINLQSLLDLDNEECTLKEIAIQKEVIIERDKTIEKLQRSFKEADLNNKLLKEEVDRYKENFEVEKANWLDEKEKVIRYQKQLQLNYVQMYKRNKTLESEVDQLKKSLAESSQKQSQSSTKSKLFSKFSKFHESQC